MKAKLLIFSCLLLLFAGCQDNYTFSKLQTDEKNLIKDYIQRQGIEIVNEVPDDWGTNKYCTVENYDNIYYHMVNLGDTLSRPVRQNDKILVRYRRYSLTTYADTISFWTTEDSSNPIEFRYYDTSADVASAWHIIVGLMKYSGSECKFICPSKLGDNEAVNQVIPYGYDMKIQIKHY